MNCKALLICEKVIIDKEGAHSLINIMLNASIKLQETVPGALPRDIDIPSNTVAPNQWWIYTLWEPSVEDVGQSFVQIYEIYWPNGEKLTANKLELRFVQENDKLQQSSFFVAGFPIGQQGKVKVVTWLESPSGVTKTGKLENYVRIEHLTGKSEPKISPLYSTSFTRTQ